MNKTRIAVKSWKAQERIAANRSRQTDEDAVKPQASSEINSIRPVKLGFCKVTETPLQQGSPFKKKLSAIFVRFLPFQVIFVFFRFISLYFTSLGSDRAIPVV